MNNIILWVLVRSICYVRIIKHLYKYTIIYTTYIHYVEWNLYYVGWKKIVVTQNLFPRVKSIEFGQERVSVLSCCRTWILMWPDGTSCPLSKKQLLPFWKQLQCPVCITWFSSFATCSDLFEFIWNKFYSSQSDSKFYSDNNVAKKQSS